MTSLLFDPIVIGLISVPVFYAVGNFINENNWYYKLLKYTINRLERQASYNTLLFIRNTTFGLTSIGAMSFYGYHRFKTPQNVSFLPVENVIRDQRKILSHYSFDGHIGKFFTNLDFFT